MKRFIAFMLVTLSLSLVACQRGDRGRDKQERDFTISVTKITSNSAKVRIVPSADFTYYACVVEGRILNGFASHTQFAMDLVAKMKDECTLVEEMLSGTTSVEVQGLLPNTDMCVVAFGVISEGLVTTDIKVAQFKTEAAGGSGGTPGDNPGDNPGGGGNVSDNTFNIGVSQITASNANVSVSPSNNDTYYFDVAEKSLVDSYADKKAFAKELIDDLTSWCANNGYVLGDALSSGADSYLFDNALEPNTDYYAFAFGVTANGDITTDITLKTFKTLESSSTGGGTQFTNFVYGYYENYGDYYETGAANWYIDLYTENTNEMMVIEVQTSLGATSFTGTYPIASTFKSGTAVAGATDSDGLNYGTFWGLLDSSFSHLEEVIHFKEGEVTIAKGSGNSYNIAMTAVGEDGNEYSLAFSGELEEWIESELGVSTLSSGKKRVAPRRLRATSPLNMVKTVKPAAQKIFKKVVVK